MDERKNMLFYASWYDIVQECVADDKDKLIIIDSLLRYGLKGEKVNINKDYLKMFQKQAFAQIDSAQEKHNKRVEAGRKGGIAGKGTTRNVGNVNAKKKNNSETKANENENDNVNDNVNENDNNSSLISSLPTASEIFGGYK